MTGPANDRRELRELRATIELLTALARARRKRGERLATLSVAAIEQIVGWLQEHCECAFRDDLVE